MRNLKLGAKIGLGFSLLIDISLVLGGLAVFNMGSVEKQSVFMDQAYVAEVGVVTQMERRVQRMMFNARGYDFTAYKTMLEAAQKDLAGVKDNLSQGRDLARQHPELTKLKEGVDKSTAKLQKYEELLKQAVARNEVIAHSREAVLAGGASWLSSPRPTATTRPRPWEGLHQRCFL